MSSGGGSSSGGSTPRARKLRDYIFPRPLVGAYATAPPTSAAARAPDGDECIYYEGLRALPTFGGFEVPLLPGGVLHAEDEAWLIRQLILPPCDRIVITMIPATAVANEANPFFGLASTDAAGRAAAVELTRAACAAAGRINAAAGRVLVHGVEIHSAPSRHKGGDSSEEAFTASLLEIAKMPWDGARIIVEHCDALPKGGDSVSRTPAKGFMTIDEEFRSIEAANEALKAEQQKVLGVDAGESIGLKRTRIFYGVNWARSVLETHDADTPTQHFTAGMDGRQLLPGILVFSGCTGLEGSLYGAWKDSHVPSSQIVTESLMTPSAMSAILVHWFTLDWNEQQSEDSGGAQAPFLGVKIHLKKDGAITPAERIAANADALVLIDRFLRVDEKQMGEAIRETDPDRRTCTIL